MEQLEWQMRCNENNTRRNLSRKAKLGMKLSTIRTPVLIACEGEDVSIPRK